MKKISIVLSLLAASAALFSSCNKSSNGGSEEDLILDGVYIYGEATCLDKVSSKGMFAKALDENHSLEVIPGTWEKYVALEGGKTFCVADVAGAKTVIYGKGTEEKVALEGADYSFKGTVTRGECAEGASFTVEKSGMYHIIVDMNAKKYHILPVEWAMNNNGVPPTEEGGAWNKSLTGQFNKEKMVFSLANAEMTSTFKFYYGEGWKYVVDEENGIKVGTNFGLENNDDIKLDFSGVSNALVTCGKDMKIKRSAKAIYTVNLVWEMTRGLGYTCNFQKTGTVELDDPADFKLGLVGSITGWGNEGIPDVEFTYVAGSSWDFEIAAGYEFKAGDQIKVRTPNTWDGEFNMGYWDLKIAGDTGNFSESGGNIAVKADAKYSKITLHYDGEEDEWTLTFTK